jgi:hypothetical protein
MNLNIGEIIPRRSVFFFSLSAAGILLFVLLVIVPYQRSLVTADRKIEQIRLKIEEQRLLVVLHQSFLKASAQKDGMTLIVPKKTRLPRAEAENVRETIRTIAGKSRVKVEAVVPDVKTQSPDSRYLLVNTVVRGKLVNFRSFLEELGRIPYLEHIEEVQIRKVPETEEFRVRMWLALGT